MTRVATVTTIATVAIIAVLVVVFAIHAIPVNTRPHVVDNGWREPAWFPPAQPALSVRP